MKLKIDKRVAEGATVLTCHGRIMFGEDSNALRDAVREALGQARDALAQHRYDQALSAVAEAQKINPRLPALALPQSYR